MAVRLSVIFCLFTCAPGTIPPSPPILQSAGMDSTVRKNGSWVDGIHDCRLARDNTRMDTPTPMNPQPDAGRSRKTLPPGLFRRPVSLLVQWRCNGLTITATAPIDPVLPIHRRRPGIHQSYGLNVTCAYSYGNRHTTDFRPMHRRT